MDNDVIELGRQEQADLIKQVSMINDVAKRLKKIPELPSEIVTDSHGLTKVEFPDEEGVLTYMQGYDYPYKGYPFYEFVDKIDLIKKLSRSLQSGFYHALKNTWTRYLLIPFIPTLGRKIFWVYAFSFSRLIERFNMRTNRYSEFVRELHRSFSVSWGDEDPQIYELRKMIREVECMILEFDNAYRFRAQDLLPELDKDLLRKDAVREINRLLDIWIEREKTVEIKDSWKLLKLFVTHYLSRDKKLLQLFVRVLLELDISKCVLSVEDKYFCIPRKDYSFAFMDNPNEADGKLIEKIRVRQEADDKIAGVKKQSTLQHEKLAETHKRQQAENPTSPETAQKIKNEIAVLDFKIQQVQAQNQREYEEAKKKVITDNLTDAQRILLDKQQKEIQELDADFDKQLQTI